MRPVIPGIGTATAEGISTTQNENMSQSNVKPSLIREGVNGEVLSTLQSNKNKAFSPFGIFSSSGIMDNQGYGVSGDVIGKDKIINPMSAGKQYPDSGYGSLRKGKIYAFGGGQIGATVQSAIPGQRVSLPIESKADLIKGSSGAFFARKRLNPNPQ